MNGLALFTLHASRTLGERIAAELGVGLAAHEERDFDDGEHKARALESVRERDVYVVQSLHADAAGSVNDKLLRLLLFAGSLRDAGAARVTAVLPYLCYARKDRRTQPRDPVSTRYVAAMIEAVGVERVVALDVHDRAAFDNALRIRAEHLEARKPLAARIAELAGGDAVAVVAPDPGGFKRAEAFRVALEARLGRPVTLAFMEKHRSGGEVRGALLAGEVAGRTAVIVDDIVASGTTLDRAARACLERGAARVIAAATHGLFTGAAAEVLAAAALERVVVTDSVPPSRLEGTAARVKVDVVGIAPLLAQAIRCLHTGGSLSELLAP